MKFLFGVMLCRAMASAQELGYHGPPLGTGSCPIIVSIDQTGQIWTNRFHGWYQTSEALLSSDVAIGCKESRITSITLTPDIRASKQRVIRVFHLIQEHAQKGVTPQLLPAISLGSNGRFLK